MGVGAIVRRLPWGRDFVIVAGAGLLAVGLHFALGPSVVARTSLAPYLLAVLLAGCLSARAGFATAALCAVALATLLPPVGMPLLVDPVDQALVAMFLATAGCIAMVCWFLHRGRQRIQHQADGLRSAAATPRCASAPEPYRGRYLMLLPRL